MKLSVVIIGLLVLGACVPAKKYNDLVEREKKCSEELEMYKTNALNYEGKAKELFEEDLKLARELGVRGFPTIFFTDSSMNIGGQELQALQQQLTVARGPTTFSDRLTGEVHDTLRLREGPIEAVISPTGRIGRI